MPGFARSAPAELAARGWPRWFAPSVDSSARVAAAGEGIELPPLTAADPQSGTNRTSALRVHGQSDRDSDGSPRRGLLHVAAFGFGRIVVRAQVTARTAVFSRPSRSGFRSDMPDATGEKSFASICKGLIGADLEFPVGPVPLGLSLDCRF